MKRISLEDFCEDIVGKAQRGLGLSDQELAERTGVATTAIRAIKNGDYGDEEAIRSLALELQLGPDQLVACARGEWYPNAQLPDGVYMENTPYHDMFVNAFVVSSNEPGGEAAVFDTGANANGLIDLVRSKDLNVTLILLTHGHGDHILDLAKLRREFPGAGVFAGEGEGIKDAAPFAPGREFEFAGLNVETRLTWGHAPAGITYVVRGLSVPVAIVGDAVFAGSMGGGMVSYPDALRTNREEILTLSDDTVICPGHGPVTTVGEEKKHNPFFAV